MLGSYFHFGLYERLWISISAPRRVSVISLDQVEQSIEYKMCRRAQRWLVDDRLPTVVMLPQAGRRDWAETAFFTYPHARIRSRRFAAGGMLQPCRHRIAHVLNGFVLRGKIVF
jgi:hypothetical protein